MVYEERIKALLRLFKCYEFNDTFVKNNDDDKNKLMEQGLKHGILFEDPSYNIPPEIVIGCIDMYGIKPEEWNNTFHKSFKTVIDTPINVLVAQQLIHYFTTYGLESLDLYNKDLVYIPAEKLEIPEFEGNIKLVVIHALTKEQIHNKLIDLLSSGIALSRQTIDDIIVLVDYIDEKDVEKVKNREIKNILYDMYNIVPKNNIEFLRYLIYKTTNETLLIKNKTMINKIRNCDKEYAYKLFNQYITKYGSEIELAKIFLRYKDLFLAYKIHDDDTKYKKYQRDMNKLINRLRKLSNKYHECIKESILDKLTTFDDYSEYCENKETIMNSLNDITIFREIRIINSLKYRVKLVNDNIDAKKSSILYKIRNNKVFATKLKNIPTDEQIHIYKEIITKLEKHLINRLELNFKNKTFYIPENIKYTLPTSEKQFIGNLPIGTKIILPRHKNMIIGVFWTNLDNERVDLDLKAMNEQEEIGWNASYYNARNSVVFSGDMTDAPKPNGATETMLISSNVENSVYTLKLNNFTRNKATVPFEFFVAGTSDDIGIHKEDWLSHNYTINPNDVLISFKNAFYNDINSSYINTSLTLGQVSIEDNSIIISLMDFEDMSKSVSSMDNVNWHIHNYNKLYRDAQLCLDDIIIKCGGKIVTTKEIEEYILIGNDENGEAIYKKQIKPVDYDLSLETLEKDTLINLLI